MEATVDTEAERGGKRLFGRLGDESSGKPRRNSIGISSMMTRNSSRKIFAFIDNGRLWMQQNLQELHG
jgi:hypothetical protein